MHIDYNICKDFSKKIPLLNETIADLKSYHLTNIIEDDEVYEELALVLLSDYQYRFANYKGYVEEGMNLRDFAELRKSAILNSKCREFYDAHSTLKNRQEIKELRIRYLGQKFRCLSINGYTDEDWQLYFVMLWSTRKKYKDYIDVDLEAHHVMQDTIEGYRPKCYMLEALRIYSDYDAWGRLRKEPLDARQLLREQGYDV